MLSALLFGLTLLSPAAHADPAVPAKITFGESGDQWLRVITWTQIWARGMQTNPGTTIEGEEDPFDIDFGIRRARVLLWGQINPRVHIVTHFGINNQTFNNLRKPQLFMHDAWVQAAAVPDKLVIGAGLHYWNGVSRMSSASTLNFLALDAPILNWFTIEKSDQFARQMGVFAKGKLGGLDYRVSINKPFNVAPTLTPGGMADYTTSHTLSYAGYFQYMFADQESNALPYTVGTYLGQKSVLNIGAGVYYHPEAMGSLDLDGVETKHDMLATGVDVFIDRPIGEGAITAYGVWYHFDFGPNNVRNVGIMNTGAGGTTFAGGGNAYPMIGTGEHFYAQVGYLLPVTVEQVRFQPYATAQVSILEALDDPSTIYEVGANALLSGHNAKITAHYRSRPIFETQGERTTVTQRASEGIVQYVIVF